MHPLYSADVALRDYYLFLFVTNDLEEEEAFESRLSQYFANKDKGFHESVIMTIS